MTQVNTAYQEWKDGEFVKAPSYMFNGTEALDRNSDELNSISTFRYYWLIQNLTNVSLYNESIDNDSLHKIADALQKCIKGKFTDVVNVQKETELNALYNWFKKCADNGYFLRKEFDL